MSSKEGSSSDLLKNTTCTLDPALPDCNSLNDAINLRHHQCIERIIKSYFDGKHKKEEIKTIPILHLIIKYGNYNKDEKSKHDMDLRSKYSTLLKDALRMVLENNNEQNDSDEGLDISKNERYGDIDTEGIRKGLPGFTPLHRAASQGNGEYVTTLLDG